MIDLIIKLDNECRIKALQQVGKHPILLSDNELIGEKIDHMLGASLKEQGTAEFNSKLYRYQCITEAGERVLYLSSDTVLLDFYKQIFEHMSEGVQIFDHNGCFLVANPASEELGRYDSREYQGKHLLDIYDVNDKYSTVLTVLRTKKSISNRCGCFKMKNGTTLTTINSGYPLIIDNCLHGAIVFESDLAVLKRFEKRICNLEAYIGSTGAADQATMYNFDDILHEAKSMQDIIHFAKKVSLTDSAILIVGATGTGKELVAQSIHSFSSRRNKPFIDINCSAIPSSLFESIFFGTEKGAFTGSVSKPGLFEMANGGTIFLDEVNSISPEIQVKLLRVLQEKRFQRIGGSKYIQCNVRILAAANEDLNELMQQQKVRRDFYYRISTIKIDLPDLKDRDKDSLLLAQHFLHELCKQYSREELTLAQEVLAVFQQYEWPGNVRELHHVIEYAFNRVPDDASIITLDCLPGYLRLLKSESGVTLQGAKVYEAEDIGTFDEHMKQFEYELIRRTLTANGWNITHSAQQLGMSRQCLQYRMKKLNLYEK